MLLITLLLTHASFAQLLFSSHTTTTVNCIKVNVRNTSKDSIYLIFHGEMIQYWDTCFAYDLVENNDRNIIFDITHYNRALDGGTFTYFSLYPKDSISFGMRTPGNIRDKEVYIHAYVATFPAIAFPDWKKIDPYIRNRKKSYKSQWVLYLLKND